MAAETLRPARRGLMLILSSPSGAGKTTLTRNLKSENNLDLSISVTTRAKRGSEIDGVAYHFIAQKDFIARRDRGDLLEWAEVHGNYYATSRVWLKQQVEAGRDTLLEIDWQGAQQVRKHFPDAVGVFILPPSMDELEARLRALVRRSADPGATPVGSNITQIGAIRYDKDSGALYLHGEVMELTPRELALMHALLAQPGHAVTKERLYELVFPGQLDVQYEAIEVVVYRLRKKLVGTGLTLMTLRGLGYLLRTDA